MKGWVPMERLAVYAGSFDPLTNGHLWMIERGVELFDQLIIAIGVNPDKQTRFSIPERLAMIQHSIEDSAIPLQARAGIQIVSFDNQFLIQYAQHVGAHFILRGIRNEIDAGYERGMRNINGDIAPNITTTFLMPPRPICEISSSMVKGLVGPIGWEAIVRLYVPEAVFLKLKEHHDRNQDATPVV